jgi:hypothetical protein
MLTSWLSSYLWPGYTEEASNFHVLLIALIANVKRREHLATWSKWLFSYIKHITDHL